MRLLPFLIAAAALASEPLRDSCSEDSLILALVDPADAIQIRHAVVGESRPCYSVVSKNAQGFILGSTLPAIQEFERKRALESRIAIPVLPVAQAADRTPLPPVAPPFEAWRGVDTRGKRIQVAASDAKVTLVTFWAVESGTARRYVENLKKTEAEFRPKGLRSFGLIEAGSTARAKYFLEDMGLDCPQAYDRQGLAAKYHVDAVRGTTLVIDPSNNVVAITSNPAEIRAAVTRLLSL
jgi:hypothetical protein